MSIDCLGNTVTREDLEDDRYPGDEELRAFLRLLARLVEADAIVLTAHRAAANVSEIVAALPVSGARWAADATLRYGHAMLKTGLGSHSSWYVDVPKRQHSLVLVLDHVPGHCRLVLGIHFDALTPDRRRRVDAYVARTPFADGYFDLWQHKMLRERRCAALEAALNQTDDGVLLLSGSGKILFANEAAEAIIVAGDGLRRVQGTLRAANLTDSVTLQVTLEHVAEAASDPRLDGSNRSQVIALRRGGGAPLLAVVVPSEVPPVDPDDVAVVIYLADPKPDPGQMLLPVCQLYGLSPTETALVGHLTAGRTLMKAAEAMRIKEQTARSYLKNVFIKTSTNRQTEVVALLLGSAVHVKQSALKNIGFNRWRRPTGAYA